MQLSTLSTLATITIAGATGISSLVAVVLYAGSRASRDEVEKIVIRHIQPLKDTIDELKQYLKTNENHS